MSARQQQTKEIFLQALDAPVADREALLERVCQGDASLRADVQKLLDVHREASGFMTAPTMDCDDKWTPLLTKLTLPPGTHIGPYELVEPLGQIA